MVPPSASVVETRQRLVVVSSIDTTLSGKNVARDPSSCPDWSSYTSLYDTFRVNGMRVRVFVPKWEILNGSSALSNWPALLCMFYDNDNSPSGAPLSLPVAAEYPNSMFSHPDGEVAFTASGLPPAMTYTGGVSGTLVTSEWTDMASPGNLYGYVGIALNNLSVGAASITTWPVVVEYDITFRGRR